MDLEEILEGIWEEIYPTEYGEIWKEIGEWFKGDLRETSRGVWKGIQMGFKRDLAEELVMDSCTPTQNPKSTKELWYTPTNKSICRQRSASELDLG
jgi:hypothetical protein